MIRSWQSLLLVLLAVAFLSCFLATVGCGSGPSSGANVAASGSTGSSGSTSSGSTGSSGSNSNPPGSGSGGGVIVSSQPQGQWSALQNLSYIPIHTTMLPDGTVLFYSYYSDSLYPQIWDPATNSVSAAAPASYELFCSGHVSLADGRVFITGGHIADYVGYAHATIFDPATNSFTSVPDMNAGRWYPTNTVLANGDVLVVSGDMTSNTTPDPLPQVYQVGSNIWRNLTTAQLQMPLYPVMFVAPNGLVFNAGPNAQTRYLDTTGTGSWTKGPAMIFSGTRDYGPGVMYDAGKILEVGGSDPPTATAEIIDLNSATPAWKSTASMNYPRRQHNAVTLPGGQVLVVGGSSGSGFDNSAAPVYPSEMWDPNTGDWTMMAASRRTAAITRRHFCCPTAGYLQAVAMLADRIFSYSARPIFLPEPDRRSLPRPSQPDTPKRFSSVRRTARTSQRLILFTCRQPRIPSIRVRSGCRSSSPRPAADST